MARTALALVSLVVLAAAAWLILGSGPAEAPEGGGPGSGAGGSAETGGDAGSGGAADGGQGEISRDDTVDPDGATPPVEAIPDDERIPSFTGQVLGPDGAPREGAVVEVWGMVGFAAQLDADGDGLNVFVRWRTESGEDGGFRLPEAPREGLRYLLRVRAEDAAALLLRNLPAVPGRTRALGTLQLTAGDAVTGLVRDADGEAVSGAEVQAFRWIEEGGRPKRTPLADALVRSDAEGRFRLEHLPPGRLRLRALADGHAEGWSAPFDLGGGEETVDIRLPATKALPGVVLDRDRKPLAETQISLRASPRQTAVPDLSFQTVSGADGGFRLLLPEGVEEGLLAVTADGHYRLQRALRLDEQEGPLELLLEPLPTLSGRCLRAGGGVAADCEVLLVELRSGVSDLTAMPVVTQTRSDADGRWTLQPDLREAQNLRFQVLARDEAGARAESGRFTLLDPTRTRLPSFELTLEPGMAVSGRVFREDGQPVADARLLLRKLEFRQPSRLPAVDESRRGGPVVARGGSEADGSFRFVAHAVGDYRVEAFLPGATPGESAEFALLEGQGEVRTEVRLAPPCALAGQVSGPYAELGPLQVLASAPGMEPMAAEVGADGRFRFDSPWPAKWTLELRETQALEEATAFVFGGTEPLARADGVVTEPGRETEVLLELDFAGLGTLEGLARLDGAPAANFRVFLLPMDLSSQGDPRLDGRELMRRTRIARVGADGRYRIVGVAADQHWLVLCRPGTWPEGMFGGDRVGEVPTGMQAQRVRVAADAVTRADFEVQVGSLRMQIGNTDRDTLSAAATLVPVDGMSRSYGFILGEEGHLIERIPAGAYKLVLVSGGVLRSEMPVQVPAGTTGEINVLLAEPHMLPEPALPGQIHDGD